MFAKYVNILRLMPEYIPVYIFVIIFLFQVPKINTCQSDRFSLTPTFFFSLCFLPVRNFLAKIIKQDENCLMKKKYMKFRSPFMPLLSSRIACYKCALCFEFACEWDAPMYSYNFRKAFTLCLFFSSFVCHFLFLQSLLCGDISRVRNTMLRKAAKSTKKCNKLKKKATFDSSTVLSQFIIFVWNNFRFCEV